jgi:hypothetical protein
MAYKDKHDFILDNRIFFSSWQKSRNPHRAAYFVVDFVVLMEIFLAITRLAIFSTSESHRPKSG